MYKQISSNSFKNEITGKFILHILYINSNVCKQKNVKLGMLYIDIWNHLNVWKQMINRIIHLWYQYKNSSIRVR